MREKRLDEFIKNHEMFVQELLEYAKNEPESFREAIAEIIRVISDYKALINRVRELEKRLKIYQKRSWFEDYEKVAKQNKRYREAIESIKNKLDTVHFREYQTVDFRHEVFIELLEALEGEGE